MTHHRRLARPVPGRTNTPHQGQSHDTGQDATHVALRLVAAEELQRTGLFGGVVVGAGPSPGIDSVGRHPWRFPGPPVSQELLKR